jgi:hypothetical protein
MTVECPACKGTVELTKEEDQDDYKMHKHSKSASLNFLLLNR